MRTVVLKFGGAAVATPEQFSRVAEIICDKKKEFDRVVTVVSAMRGATDDLISLALRVNPQPPRREYDMLVSVGERISISLLAMALSLKGQDAVSFTGSQSGIITCAEHAEARILDVRPYRILPQLEKGKVVIVAGFQGVSEFGEITTLGRGGSDTTAVALAVALGAEKAEFYKDVSGIYDEDPKANPAALRFTRLSYHEALCIAEGGARILHPRCIELACKNSLPLQVMSFVEGEQSDGTLICGSHAPLGAPLYELRKLGSDTNGNHSLTSENSQKKTLTH